MNIVYTAATPDYYDALLTLISSIHEYCNDTVDRVVVYGIGLDDNQKDNISNLLKVELRLDNTEYSTPIRESYLFKLIILKDSLKERVMCYGSTQECVVYGILNAFLIL